MAAHPGVALHPPPHPRHRYRGPRRGRGWRAGVCPMWETCTPRDCSLPGRTLGPAQRRQQSESVRLYFLGNKTCILQ